MEQFKRAGEMRGEIHVQQRPISQPVCTLSHVSAAVHRPRRSRVSRGRP